VQLRLSRRRSLGCGGPGDLKPLGSGARAASSFSDRANSELEPVRRQVGADSVLSCPLTPPGVNFGNDLRYPRALI
jgi:hypothetical protein